MKPGELGAIVASGIVIIALVIVLAVGLAGGSSEITYSDGPGADPPDDPSAGIVSGSRTSGGSSFLGIQIQAPTPVLEVAVIASPDCVSRDGSEERLTSTGECADVPAIGPIVGTGRSRLGDNYYLVLVEVSDDCLEAVAIGDRWPTGLPECE